MDLCQHLDGETVVNAIFHGSLLRPIRVTVKLSGQKHDRAAVHSLI